MTSPTAIDVKVFVPTKDLGHSLRFYEAIGWSCNWRTEGLAEIELAGHRLYLQAFYAKQWAENFMIYVEVENAIAWYDHVEQVLASGEYPTVSAKPPQMQDYGAKVTFVYDPVGVLIHFAESQTSIP